MVGIELVRDRATKQAFPREERMTERLVGAAKERGLLLYPSTGCADGVNGDLVVLGPPFVITEAEIAELSDRLVSSLEAIAT